MGLATSRRTSIDMMVERGRQKGNEKFEALGLEIPFADGAPALPGWRDLETRRAQCPVAINCLYSASRASMSARVTS